MACLESPEGCLGVPCSAGPVLNRLPQRPGAGHWWTAETVSCFCRACPPELTLSLCTERKMSRPCPAVGDRPDWCFTSQRGLAVSSPGQGSSRSASFLPPSQLLPALATRHWLGCRRWRQVAMVTSCRLLPRLL